MEAKPELRFESDKATKEAEKQERREIKENRETRAQGRKRGTITKQYGKPSRAER